MAVLDTVALGQELYDALRSCVPLAPLTVRYPDMTIDDAYAISLAFLKARQEQSGEVIVGKKIGVTSKPVQDMLGVFQPDFGFLTDTMLASDGQVYMCSLVLKSLIAASKIGKSKSEIQLQIMRPAVSLHLARIKLIRAI